jgi:hypothetical protein
VITSEAKSLRQAPGGEAFNDCSRWRGNPHSSPGRLVGLKRGALNARVRRAGGAAPGLVIEGWCCVGLAVPEGGGPAQALWQQA